MSYLAPSQETWRRVDPRCVCLRSPGLYGRQRYGGAVDGARIIPPVGRVDLNADVGESFGPYTIGHDGVILRYVTSANVACGLHGGDPSVMRRTVRLAAAGGVAVGAHPGFADLQGFGRRPMHLSAQEVEDLVAYQIGALAGIAAAEGARLHHVKPHGALYNMAAADRLEAEVPGLDLILLESGGDNLASTFSPDLVDFWMFVIDVAGGDDIPRKKGPGILQANLLVINKADLAPHVGVDFPKMLAEATEVRGGGAVLPTVCRKGEGVSEVVGHLRREVLFK